MQIRFVDDHYTRVFQRGLITEVMVSVVADLVEREIEIRRIESRGLRAERRDFGQF
jgi:hypothetical protein